MDEEKRKRLEAAGWVSGDYGDFLGLTEAERQHVELLGVLSKAIKRLREASGMTRRALARRIGSTTAVVANIETIAHEVTLDLMFRAFFEAGGRIEDLTGGPSQAVKTEPSPAEPGPKPKPAPRKRLARSG